VSAETGRAVDRVQQQSRDGLSCDLHAPAALRIPADAGTTVRVWIRTYVIGQQYDLWCSFLLLTFLRLGFIFPPIVLGRLLAWSRNGPSFRRRNTRRGTA
jgi:hypothetical protein